MKFSQSLAVAIPAVPLLLISTPAPAQTVEQSERLEPMPCVEEVQANLKEHNIEWEEVKNEAEFFRNDPTADRQVGIHVWVRPPQCEEGWLIMDMAASCAVRSTWTTEGCSLPGLETY
jgi:hypothetical protein